MEGKKYDEGKVPLNLLPGLALEEVAKVLDFGKQKYGAYNWTKGMDWSRLIAAALRHINKFNSGIDLDDETKISHAAHAACCLLFLLEYQKRNLGKDDRHKYE